MRASMVRGVLGATAALAAGPALALQVFATVPEWGALVHELGGERVEVFTATTALQNVHRIQARPSLIAKYRQADLLVATGADLEAGWLPALAAKGNNPRLLPGAPGHFEAFRFVEMLEVPQALDRAQGDVHPWGNPHFHLDPRNFPKIARPLAERLAQLDPAGAEVYRQRLAGFEARWQAALARWAKQAAPLSGLRVVSTHGDGVYLYAWLGLVEVATLEPKPGVPPSAGHLESVLEQVRGQPPRMVLRAAYQDPKPSEWISRRGGFPVVELPYTVGGTPGATDLERLFDVTLKRLLAGAGAAS